MTERPHLFRSNSFLGHLTNTLVTTCGVLLAGYLTLKGTVMQQDTEQMRLLAERVSTLEDRLDQKSVQINDLNRELLTVRAENSVMRIQLDKGYSASPRGTLYAYMNALQTPAWCKEWAETTFIMMHINPSYESTYGVTRARYVGHTDADVFPPKLAQAWTENDKKAYERRGFIRFVEPVLLPDGREVDMEFWKFYLRLPDTGELVCGIQIGEVLHAGLRP